MGISTCLKVEKRSSWLPIQYHVTALLGDNCTKPAGFAIRRELALAQRAQQQQQTAHRLTFRLSAPSSRGDDELGGTNHKSAEKSCAQQQVAAWLLHLWWSAASLARFFGGRAKRAGSFHRVHLLLQTQQRRPKISNQWPHSFGSPSACLWQMIVGPKPRFRPMRFAYELLTRQLSGQETWKGCTASLHSQQLAWRWGAGRKVGSEPVALVARAVRTQLALQRLGSQERILLAP